jgi:hypothetical protein
MLLSILVVLLLAGEPSQAKPPAQSPPAEPSPQTRLADYEQQASTGKPDPAKLAAIAATVLQNITAGANAGPMIEACSSDFAKELSGCDARLSALAKRQTAALTDRAHAAAASIRRKQKDAAPLLLQLAKGANAAQLEGIAPALALLPATDSVPLVAPLLKSNNPSAITVGCRVLAEIDAAESREAIREFLNVPMYQGTQPWFACTLAAGRLGDVEAQQTSRSISNYVHGYDLVIAADVLVARDEELAVSLLQQATREARGVTRLDAADRLVKLRPEVAQKIMEEGLDDQDPAVRAAALQVHRHLELEPSRRVRARLLDTDPEVRLRAAETILGWDVRRREKQERPKPAPNRIDGRFH